MNLWRAVKCTRPSFPAAVYHGTRWASTARVSVFKKGNSINAMRKHIVKDLKNGRYQAAVEAVSKHMTSTTLHNRSRFQSYESAVDVFLKYGNMNAAKVFYVRMKTEGFIPSVRLRASLLVMNNFGKEKPLKTFLTFAQEAVALEDFSEKTLAYLLSVVYVNLPCTPQMVEGIVDLFLQTRPGDYKLSTKTRQFLAYLHSRLDSPELAVKWSPNVADEAPSQDRQRLFALAGTNPKLQSIIQAAILRLDKNDKEHDRTLYNSLIDVFLKERDYQRVFQIYDLMLTSGSTVSPNSETFKLLFDVLWVSNKPRTLRTRNRKKPLNAPSARQLFHHMVYVSSRNRQAHAISTYSLTAALHAFMKKDDYPAVFTVLRTFHMHGLKATVEVYTIIFEGLIRRIREDLRFTPAISTSELHRNNKWVHRFLGHRHIPEITDDSIFIEALLNIGLQPKLTLDPVSLSPQTQLREFLFWVGPQAKAITRFLELSTTPYRIPGPLVVMGMLKAWDDRWDVVPLERILRRAILASYAKLFVRPAKAVSEQIAAAKREMIYGEKPEEAQ